MGCLWRESLKTAQNQPNNNHFEPFVAILWVRSNPWRSKRILGLIFRFQLSDVSSDVVAVISCELVQPRQNLFFCMPTKVRRTAPADPHGSGSALRRHKVCSPRVPRSSLWSQWKRAQPTPWSVPAMKLHFGRGPKLRSRAIELEGGGGTRRGAISAHYTTSVQL